MVVPQSGKVAKEARECVQECVSEFISFITSEASERCQAEKRKTINGEDILFAMSTLGFDNYVEPLKLYLQKYREAMKGERQIESELTGLGGDVMTAQQLQGLQTTEGDVLLTYSNGQQIQFPLIIIKYCTNISLVVFVFCGILFLVVHTPVFCS